VGILRVGQLCGDKQSGRWNEKEGWPLMIRTAEEVGCLPLLDEVCPSRLLWDSAGMLICRTRRGYRSISPRKLCESLLLSPIRCAAHTPKFGLH